mmetsp:Transcript_33634/g.34262  ORF Transcript_33634/g.34262 Transcript_33634/m.34262 type:complete len:311 (+) Transcript_33634:76-1008(+)
MATRNLTRKFVDERTSFNALSKPSTIRNRNASESNNELLQDGENSSTWKAAKESSPTLGIENMDSIEQNVAKIQSKLLQLKVLHTKRLMVNFETDETKQEKDIEIMTQEITDIFRETETILKGLNRHVDGSTEAERIVRNNIQRSMAKKLQGLSMSFRTTQKEYLGRLKAQKSGSGAQAFDFLDSKSKKKPGNDDSGFTEAQMLVVEDMETMVNQRDEEINRIAQSIEELAQIFKELAVLVIDQGSILDRIDYNMEQSVETAKEGIVQLEKAEEHQKSAMSVKCIMVLIVLIAILLIILILKHTTFNKKN